MTLIPSAITLGFSMLLNDRPNAYLLQVTASAMVVGLSPSRILAQEACDYQLNCRNDLAETVNYPLDLL